MRRSMLFVTLLAAFACSGQATTYAVDRIEGDIAVLVSDVDGSVLELPAAALSDLEEGAVYRGATFVRDRAEESRRLDQLQQRLAAIRN